MLVGIAVAVADDLDIGAVGVHPRREAGGPFEAIVAGLVELTAGIGEPIAAASLVGAIGDEGLARLVGEDRPAVAVVEIPFPVRTSGDRVERVVVVAGIESGQKHFPLVDRWIEAQVPVDVGVDDEIGRLGNDHDVVEYPDAERGDQSFLLDESVGAVGLAVAIRVFQHDDPVATGAATLMPTVVHALGHPDPTFGIDVEVGWIVEVGGRSPDSDLETLRHLEGERFDLPCRLRSLPVLGKQRGHDEERGENEDA